MNVLGKGLIGICIAGLVIGCTYRGISIAVEPDENDRLEEQLNDPFSYTGPPSQPVPASQSAEISRQSPSPARTAVKPLPLPAFPDFPAPAERLSAEDSGVIYFPTKSPYDFIRVLHGFDDLEGMTGKATLILPDGATMEAPVPAMVILHGSGGIKEGREFDYAALFAEQGIASFVVDYYAPRGALPETPYQLKTMITTEIDVLTDAYAALKILATHPLIDADRIGLTGYSYGGMATRYALDARVREIMAPESPPFALHIDVYGPCFQAVGEGPTTGAPYLALHGTNDNSVDPALCADVYRDLKMRGSRVESHVFDGAGHAWEVNEPLGPFGQSYIRGCRFSFDAQTGALLIDGREGPVRPTATMSRSERAGIRAGLAQLAAPCIGTGYLVGRDAATDIKSREKQIAFMKREFGL